MKSLRRSLLLPIAMLIPGQATRAADEIPVNQDEAAVPPYVLPDPLVANDGTRGSELWVTDGTAAGTTIVKDIRTGTYGSSPNGLTNSGGTLFFSANDGTTGFELWKSDGTAVGTTQVKDIRSGAQAQADPATWLPDAADLHPRVERVPAPIEQESTR